MSDKEQTTTNYPKFAANVFKGLARAGMKGNIGPTALAAKAQLRRTQEGAYLNPQTNPYLAQAGEAVQRQGLEAFNRALSRIRGQSQAMGNLESAKSLAMQGEAARKMGQDVTDQIAQLYGSNYARERGAQLASAGQAIDADNLRLRRMMGVANLLRGAESRTVQPFDPWNDVALPLGQMAASAVCAVAMEVLGTETPDWRYFRAWLTFRAPRWFYRLYEKYCGPVATWMAARPMVKDWVRPWFEEKVRLMRHGGGRAADEFYASEAYHMKRMARAK